MDENLRNPGDPLNRLLNWHSDRLSAPQHTGKGDREVAIALVYVEQCPTLSDASPRRKHHDQDCGHQNHGVPVGEGDGNVEDGDRFQRVITELL